jgi:CheY-like chemotaxis protein
MSRHILVVEDQEDNKPGRAEFPHPVLHARGSLATANRQILRDLLGNAGYELTEAENGEEALAAAAKQRPDRILMDIATRPPGGSGPIPT